jgi:DNA-binding transcriptional LysR family regulator
LPDRDSRGIPYDARIHSSPPNLTDKNVWRKKRGVDELTVNRIEAELTGAMSAPPAVPVPPVPVAPAAPVAPVAPAAPVAPVAEDFPALMARLGPYFVADMAGTTAKLTAALTPLGITAFPMLAARPDLMPAAVQAINAALSGTGVAIVDEAMIRPELAAGTLRRFNTLHMDGPYGYWFVDLSREGEHKATVRLFREWLREPVSDQAPKAEGA